MSIKTYKFNKNTTDAFTHTCLAELGSFVSSLTVAVFHCDPKQRAQWQQNVQSFSQRWNRLREGQT